MSFRFGHVKNLTHVRVDIPRDEEGFIGRECPVADCEGYFKIKLGTGLTGNGLPCVCPYCGHSGPHNTFFTKEQIKFGRSVAKRKMVEALRKDLKSMEFSTKPTGPFGLSMSLKLQPGQLPPVKTYREQVLETKVTCDNCTLEYSVFGVFAFCPDCSVHNSLQILGKNFNVTEKQLILAEGIDDTELRQHLIEDALENCVSAFDGFAREACRVRSGKSSKPAKCEKLTFQNLNFATEVLNELFNIDLRSSVATSQWDLAHVRFMQRHLLAHKSGVADQKYITEVGTGYGAIGRRITIHASDVRELIKIVETIGTQLIKMLPIPL